MDISNLPDGTIIAYANRRYVVTRDAFDISKKILTNIEKGGPIYPNSWKIAKIIFNPEHQNRSQFDVEDL